MGGSATPAGLVLAGGRGSRMGGDVAKPLIPLAGRPLIAHVIDRFASQVAPLILAAPRGQGFERFGLEIAPDRRPGLPGPLAGIEAGLLALDEMARSASVPDGPRALVVVAGDTPFLPGDLVERLKFVAADRPVIARFAGRPQPAAGLWPISTLGPLTKWLDSERPLAIRAFLESTGYVETTIEPSADAPGGDPFFNVNTPADLARAAAFLAQTRF